MSSAHEVQRAAHRRAAKYAGLRVTEWAPGEWRAYHDGRQIMRVGETRAKALAHCADAVSEEQRAEAKQNEVRR